MPGTYTYRCLSTICFHIHRCCIASTFLPLPVNNSQWYQDGTKCDVTNRARKTEVRYYCDPTETQVIRTIKVLLLLSLLSLDLIRFSTSTFDHY
jgi:hypothetical protein